ncbi:Pyrazinamidase/nicotinamidase [Diplonema papillatum]|nr:Pyrazinamidase/nicotinamidase [Diplonema papillatum]
MGKTRESMADALQRTGALHEEYVGLLEDAGSRLEGGMVNVSSEDVLIVVDMQNDFLPAGKENRRGGRFGVPEGMMVVPLIKQLIHTFLSAGARVVVTRDYHPVDHASFASQGGPFPAHCVQGAYGAEITPEIAEALKEGIEKHGDEKVIICFKGFHEDVDSFGSFVYSPEYMKTRLQKREGKDAKRRSTCGLIHWTGAYVLKSSSLSFDGEVNVNAPPDILATCSSVSLAKHLGRARNAYFCGLAMDYCVVDSAMTGSEQASLFSSVSMVLDATRAAHVTGVGLHGSGFLTDPQEFTEKVQKAGIQLVTTLDLTHERLEQVLLNRPTSTRFPNELGPLGLHVVNFKVNVDAAKNEYTMRSSTSYGACTGRCSSAEKGVVFLYPIGDMRRLQRRERTLYLDSHDPKWQFIVNGGFSVTVDSHLTIVAAITTVGGAGGYSRAALPFNAPQPFKASFAQKLYADGRFSEITLPILLSQQYTYFTWLNANEVISNDQNEKWCDWPHGAFAYLKSSSDYESCIMFTVRDMTVAEILQVPTSPR